MTSGGPSARRPSAPSRKAPSRCSQEAGLLPASVVKTVVVGNPIMIHILNGIDPYQLTHVPYVPVTAGSLRSAPRDFGWTFQASGYVETLPLVSAYVGADTIAMIVALGLGEEKATTLSIDIGTNGEMVLARAGEMLATSTAAGPAFEGAQISCGMRALDGAIYDVAISAEGELRLQVVGNVPARGICGTGLMAGIAELLNRGVVDATGRIAAPSDVERRHFARGSSPSAGTQARRPSPRSRCRMTAASTCPSPTSGSCSSQRAPCAPASRRCWRKAA